MKRLMMILAVAGLAVGAAAQADVWTVDQGGGGDFTTISAALGAASDGDTINVNAGTYDEKLVIQKAVNLIGQDSDTTIITYTGSSTEQQIFLGSNTGFDFADQVAIENFTIRNGGSLTGDNDLIKFRAHGVGGQVIIRNNAFDGDGADGSLTAAKAIEESYESNNFLITQNQFDGCQYGIWANGLQDGAISDNRFTNCTSGAIGMGGKASGDSAPHDIAVTGNLMHNGKYGMVLAENLHDITFSCNTITQNSHTGILYWEYGPDDWTNVVFQNSNIVGNAVGFQGFSDPDGPAAVGAISAEDCWWGDAAGPSGLGAGTGDSVLLQGVDFDPWLAAPAPCAPDIPPVPEPGGLGLLGVAMLGLRRRRRS